MPRPMHMCEAWPPKSCIEPYQCAQDGDCRGCVEAPAPKPPAPRTPAVQAVNETCIDDGKGGCINPWCPTHGV